MLYNHTEYRKEDRNSTITTVNKVGRFKIIPEKRLILIYFIGEISIDELIFLNKCSFKAPGYDASFDVIVDLRDCYPKANIDDLRYYINFINENKSFYKKRKGVYLTSKPEEVVATTLFSKMHKDVPFEIEIFSTVSAMTFWLNRNRINTQFIENELKKIRLDSHNVYLEE